MPTVRRNSSASAPEKLATVMAMRKRAEAAAHFAVLGIVARIVFGERTMVLQIKLCTCDSSLTLRGNFIKEMSDGARGILDHGFLHR